MSVLMEFSMFPTDKGESVSAYVSPVIKMIAATGVEYQLTAMGTLVEAKTLRQALEIVEKAYEVLAQQGCQRVYSSLKIDIRPGKENRLSGKVESIKEKIGDLRT